MEFDGDKLDRLIMDSDEALVSGILLGVVRTFVIVTENPDMFNETVVEVAGQTLTSVERALEGKL